MGPFVLMKAGMRENESVAPKSGMAASSCFSQFNEDHHEVLFVWNSEFPRDKITSVIEGLVLQDMQSRSIYASQT